MNQVRAAVLLSRFAGTCMGLVLAAVIVAAANTLGTGSSAERLLFYLGAPAGLVGLILTEVTRRRTDKIVRGA